MDTQKLRSKIKKIEDLSRIEKIELKIKWWWLSQVIYSQKRIDKDKYTLRNDYEHEAVKIFRLMSQINGTDLRYSVKTEKRYAINLDLKIYFIVDRNTIEIIDNGNYTFVVISRKSYSIISNIFDGHQDEQIKVIDNEIRLSIRHSLDTIYDKIISHSDKQ
jgi:hypothetical protein